MPRVIKSIEDRFWGRYIPEPNSGCWLWLGNVGANGYPTLRSGGRSAPVITAHRLSYMLHHGAIGRGEVVRHKCDVPLCVNPDHLCVGSQADNVKDMHLRGRFVASYTYKSPKTHCSRGHEFTPENTRWMRPRSRRCRTCDALREKFRIRRYDGVNHV